MVLGVAQLRLYIVLLSCTCSKAYGDHALVSTLSRSQSLSLLCLAVHLVHVPQTSARNWICLIKELKLSKNNGSRYPWQLFKAVLSFGKRLRLVIKVDLGCYITPSLSRSCYGNIFKLLRVNFCVHFSFCMLVHIPV